MKKGSFGYLRGKRILSFLKSALFLASVFVTYFAALRHFGTNKNVFSILAAVLALPAGRSIVETVLCVRARSASEEAREAITRAVELPGGTSGYDLYLTAYETAFSLSHAACGKDRVIGYTEDPGTNPALCAQHIAQMLAKDDTYGYKVTIYTDLDTYLRELETLARPEPPADVRQDGNGNSTGNTAGEESAASNGEESAASAGNAAGEQSADGRQDGNGNSAGNAAGEQSAASSEEEDASSAGTSVEKDRRAMRTLLAVSL
ncbi:MAG: hypothetical protein Q4D81_03610 [Eubacteriales bacterium]|nr:hypothetical protein [Eubacteriales bacterium]